MNNGPGCTPWISSAPMKSAITILDGKPSDSSGIKAPAVAELLADFDLYLDGAFAEFLRMARKALLNREKDANEDIAPLGPGRIPMKKPTTDPLTMGQMLSFQSLRLGNRPLISRS